MLKLTFILTLITSLCYGQQGKYTNCTATTYDSKNKAISIQKEVYNKHGKVVSRQYNSLIYKNVGSSEFTYVNDTLLSRIKSTAHEDSLLQWYVYTDARLTESRKVSYEEQVKYCVHFPDEVIEREWGDTLITHYKYNDNGQLAEEMIRYKRAVNVRSVIGAFGSTWHTNRILYTYDTDNRILQKEKQHIYRLNDRDIELHEDKGPGYPDTFTTEKITYTYLKNKTIESRQKFDIGQLEGNPFKTTIEYTFDNLGRVLTEHEYNNVQYDSEIRYYKYAPDKRIYKRIAIIHDYNTGKDDPETTLYVYK